MFSAAFASKNAPSWWCLVLAAAPPPIPKARTRFGLFHICSIRQPWWDFADSPRERYPFRFSALGPSRPLCSPFFSSGLASVREVTSSIGAGSGAASCGWEVVASGD